MDEQATLERDEDGRFRRQSMDEQAIKDIIETKTKIIKKRMTLPTTEEIRKAYNRRMDDSVHRATLKKFLQNNGYTKVSIGDYDGWTHRDITPDGDD